MCKHCKHKRAHDQPILPVSKPAAPPVSKPAKPATLKPFPHTPMHPVTFPFNRDIMPVNAPHPLPFPQSSAPSSRRASSRPSFSLKSKTTLKSLVAQSMEEQVLTGRDEVIFDQGIGGQDESGNYIVAYNEEGTSFTITGNGRYALTFQGTVKVTSACDLKIEFDCGAIEELRPFYCREYHLEAGESRDLSNVSHVPLLSGNDLRVVLTGGIGVLTPGARLIIEKAV